ncbi:MAG: hypothetical protein LCH54_16560 [Bacteroidetes bacterium]|nr:hypothetical protein [Bacteroidota bacterium]
MIIRYRIFFICFIFSLLTGCHSDKSDSITFRLDMRKEHDLGYFKPELGDKVSIAGNFNDWKPDSIILNDPDGDWIFETELFSNSRDSSFRLDTLLFKFKQFAGDGRVLANTGWEAIANRKVGALELRINEHTFQFNENINTGQQYQVKFTVGMSNQKVLGFFRPEEGDKVVVSGNFLNWNPEGLLLSDDDQDNVYSVTAPVEVKSMEKLEFKYRIVPKVQRQLLNKGWEDIPGRVLIFEQGMSSIKSRKNGINFIEIPYCDFADLNRVARFIVNSSELESADIFKPLKGDILQLEIQIGGYTILSVLYEMEWVT